jgi:hypothetical protein
MSPQEPWLKIAEVAAELRVSVRTVERLNLPRQKVGGQNRYLMSQVEAALSDIPPKGADVIPIRRVPRDGAA